MRNAWLVCVFLAGCGSDQLATDLSVSEPLDFAGVDASGWCGSLVGTVDGTSTISDCVRRYFLPFAACYRPEGGCGSYIHITGTEYCWDNGATSEIGRYMVDYDTQNSYSMGGQTCLIAHSASAGWPQVVGATVRFCVSSEGHACDGIAASGPQFATFDGSVFTCPDGTRVDVDFRNCPELVSLLDSRCPSPSGNGCSFGVGLE